MMAAPQTIPMNRIPQFVKCDSSGYHPVMENELPVFKEEPGWMTVYPAYLNKKKTIAEGRRIASTIAVEDPIVEELAEVCKSLGLEAYIERFKCYARDPLAKWGRIRIRIKDAEGNLVNPEIPTKKVYLRRAAFAIPSLKIRQERKKHMEKKIATQAAIEQTAAAKKTGGKKKGKKGKR